MMTWLWGWKTAVVAVLVASIAVLLMMLNRRAAQVEEMRRHLQQMEVALKQLKSESERGLEYARLLSGRVGRMQQQAAADRSEVNAALRQSPDWAAQPVPHEVAETLNKIHPSDDE